MFGGGLVAGKVLLVECVNVRCVPVLLAGVKNGDGVEHIERFDAIILLVIHKNIISTAR